MAVQFPVTSPNSANTVAPFAPDGRTASGKSQETVNDSDTFASVEETAETEKSRVSKRNDDQVTLSSREDISQQLATKARQAEQQQRAAELQAQASARLAAKEAESQRIANTQQQKVQADRDAEQIAIRARVESRAQQGSESGNNDSRVQEARAQETRAQSKRGDQRQSEDRADQDASTEKTQFERQQEQELAREIQQLAARDREVRSHEQAHQSVGGKYAGSASYTYTRGPDGVNYAVGGEVPIDISAIPSDPALTKQKMEQVRRAALAPAEPSAQDRRVAAVATQKQLQALAEIQAQVRAEQAAEQAAEEERRANDEERRETRSERLEETLSPEQSEDRSQEIVERFEELNQNIADANEQILTAVQDGKEVQDALNLLDFSV